MRERAEIEREMFEARQGLEENLARILHRARERLNVGARAKHALRESAHENSFLIAVAAVSVIACLAVIALVKRARA